MIEPEKALINSPMISTDVNRTYSSKYIIIVMLFKIIFKLSIQKSSRRIRQIFELIFSAKNIQAMQWLVQLLIYLIAMVTKIAFV